ncbi:MAG TPA: NAD(P)-dependent oxidoreductase [Verrucomicrobiae bacterium]|nr:NAD(P)-dependent oxidoreductase [Verrucomicrobiae bacterium]
MHRPFLITGGCGFVGRNLTKKLLSRGEEIWIIDNLFTGKLPEKWLPKDYKKLQYKKRISLYKNKKSHLYFIQADLMELLSHEMNDGTAILPNFSDVFHLASIVGGRELIENDPLLVAKDLAIDSYFFLWVSRFLKKHKRILYPSSSAAYPVTLQNAKNKTVLKENHFDFSSYIGVPDMTYGWSKLTGEYLSKIAAEKYGVHVACVRPFSGYGEDQELVYPIPAIARRFARREDPLSVWGTGKQGRDFVHIDDCIEAFFIALDNISDGSAVNIGSGKLTTFLEVIEIFSKVSGFKPQIKKNINKPVGVHSRYGNAEKLKRMGWKQTINNKEGFKRVLEFMQLHKI